MEKSYFYFGCVDGFEKRFEIKTNTCIPNIYTFDVIVAIPIKSSYALFK